MARPQCSIRIDFGRLMGLSCEIKATAALDCDSTGPVSWFSWPNNSKNVGGATGRPCEARVFDRFDENWGAAIRLRPSLLCASTPSRIALCLAGVSADGSLFRKQVLEVELSLDGAEHEVGVVEAQVLLVGVGGEGATAARPVLERGGRGLAGERAHVGV